MPGSGALCFPAAMINRIMTSRVAALAFAAIPLTAVPAFADQPAHRSAVAAPALSLSLGDASFYVSVGGDKWRGRNGRTYRRDAYGQSPWQTRQLKRDALQTCRRAVSVQGYRTGFRDVDIDDDYRIHQIGPRGFEVHLDDVEFEGRRRDFDTRVSCIVRQGSVRSISGLPQPGHRGYRGGRGNGHDWNDRGRNDHRGRGWSDNNRRTGPGGVRAYGELRGGRPGS